MELYLVRHATAEEAARAGGRDADRELTEEGRERCREAARGMVRLGFEVDVILTSPMKRAVQTAEILGGSIGPKTSVVSLDSLAPGGDHAETLRHLVHCGKSGVMLVGHMPDLSELASVLVAGNHETAFHFKKSAVLALSVDGSPGPGSAVVEGFLQPGVLRRIRKGE